MKKKNHVSKKQSGLPPGSVVFTGSQKVEKALIHYLQYDGDEILQKELDSHQNFEIHPSEDHMVDWYDIRGLHETKLIETIGEVFQIHPLILEDLVDVHNRPKYDEYPKGNFLLLKALSFNREFKEIDIEHVGIYFRIGLVVTFQETESDLFEKVRSRLHSGKGRVRTRGADYLAYALVDAIVDHYYLVLEEVEDEIELIEKNIVDNIDMDIKQNIHQIKGELLKARKVIMPLREAISRFSKSDSAIIHESSELYIRDLYDHSVQVLDGLESYRDTLNGLQDLYLSEISYKMNQVMQVLAVVTTLFVPISFLAGLYGMNFDNIPELHNPYGYYVLLGVMLILFSGSILYFKWKKWF